jgi:hypothetical protein
MPSRSRSETLARAVVGVTAELIAAVIIASTAVAQSTSSSNDAGGKLPRAIPRPNPAHLETEGSASDAMYHVTNALNDVYDQYLQLKKELQDASQLQYSALVSTFPQWGTPKGGPGVVQFVYSSNITWNPFADTGIGSGAFNFSYLRNQFWTNANTASQQNRLGLITTPNDWAVNGYQYNQLMYTHTLPGSWNWLSVAIGQYTFLAYDDNEYADNAQTNFISLPLAQNATQTYSNGALGAYAQAAIPNGQFTFAGGFQGPTDVAGEVLTSRGLSTGKYAYFAAGEWTPNFVAGGSYSLLGYTQPSVPQQPSSSKGVSFNGAQDIDPKWGLFLRANHASGNAIPIETSVSWGAICNDPFARNPLDRAALGSFWDKTNLKAVAQAARNAEWGTELYYHYTIFKGVRLTPDIQLYFNPALNPRTGAAAVFTIRTTAFF